MTPLSSSARHILPPILAPLFASAHPRSSVVVQYSRRRFKACDLKRDCVQTVGRTGKSDWKHKTLNNGNDAVALSLLYCGGAVGGLVIRLGIGCGSPYIAAAPRSRVYTALSHAHRPLGGGKKPLRLTNTQCLLFVRRHSPTSILQHSISRPSWQRRILSGKGTDGI